MKKLTQKQKNELRTIVKLKNCIGSCNSCAIENTCNGSSNMVSEAKKVLDELKAERQAKKVVKKEPEKKGEFMVFVKNRNQPNTIHIEYQTALEEAKRLAYKENETAYVLQIVAFCEVKKELIVKEN